MKVSDKQTVKSTDVHSPDMPGAVGFIINKSHPNIKAYMSELSPVVVVPCFFKVLVFLLKPVSFNIVYVKCQSKITYPQDLNKPAIGKSEKFVSLLQPCYLKSVVYTSSICTQSTSTHFRFILLCPNNFHNAFSLSGFLWEQCFTDHSCVNIPVQVGFVLLYRSVAIKEDTRHGSY